MTLPASGAITLSNVNVEVYGAPSATSGISLSFVSSITKDSLKNMGGLYSRAYYTKNNTNCNNGNCTNCACNCGNIQCQNCTANQCINCNCDAQNWLQANCNCACTFVCNASGAAYSYNCNCACDCKSDETLKYNLTPLLDATNLLQKLRGLRFNWKDIHRGDIGVSANEVQKVAPELVFEKDNVLHVDYLKFSAILIEGWKNQQSELELQKARIEKLERATG